ncbi:MAG: tetratricopeptide repeat protein [Aggregatilineales bacterium]
MVIPPIPQTGRRPLPLTTKEIAAALRQRHSADERDYFATDPDPEIRELGRLALRRDSVDDQFALGDLCARRALTEDGRLLVFYVGKALVAYHRAASTATNDVDRLQARRAAADFIVWTVRAAQANPTRRNLAVALWALADAQADPIGHAGASAPPKAGSRSASETAKSTAQREKQPLDETTLLDTGSSHASLLFSGEFPAVLANLESEPDAASGASAQESQPNLVEALLRAYAAQTAGASPDEDDIDTGQRSVSNLESTTRDRNDRQPAPFLDSALLIETVANTDEPGRQRASASGAASPPFESAALETVVEQDNLDDGAASWSTPRERGRAPQREPIRRAAPSRSRDRADAAEFEIGQRIQDRFEVVDVRRGGMGVVYLCYDHQQREPVAIKSFQSRFLENERAVARFEQEALTWIRLEKHRHIVQARLVQNIGARPHIILEHISGPEGLEPDLRSWIEHRRLTPALAVEFALHIALGMQHATQRVPGLVHRDLKPANILVSHDGIAKVTDFGLVRSLDIEEMSLVDLEKEAALQHPSERLTRVGAIIGTAPYMSPEQCRSLNVDLRSDIYAFGCLLYEMLVGRHVFNVRKFEAWLYAHLNQRPAFEPEIAATLPAQLVELVLGCLEKNPDDRPGSWGALVEVLASTYEQMTGSPAVLEITGPALEARELMDKGYSLTELGKLDEALIAYDRALALQPDYAWVWARKGRALRLLERYEEALACYEQALSLQPSYAWGWKGKGIVLERIGRQEEALACYRRATELDPNDVWNWYNQADALFKLGYHAEALSKVERALQVDDGHPNSWGKKGQILRSLGQHEAALVAYQRAIDLDPTYAWAHNGYGLVLRALGRYKDALLSFKRAARYMGDEVWHWYNVVETLVDLGQFEEAVAPAQTAVRVDPTHAYSWAKLGQVMRYMQRFDDALAAYDRAIALKPEYAWAYNGKGIVLERLGRYEEALEAYQQGAAIAPGDVWHWFNQGNALTQLGRYEEALSVLERAVQVDPKHSRSWARLGTVLRRLGRFEDALNAYSEAIQFDPDYAWAWSEIGITLNLMGRSSEALDAFRRACACAPDDPFYIYQQADTLIGLGENELAAEMLERALQHDARSAHIWAKYGQVLRRIGRGDDALRAYTRAVELEPGYGWAWNGRGLVLLSLREYEEALQSFRRASAIDRTDVWSLYYQGDALVSMGRYHEAAELLQHTVSLFPNHAESWAKLGQAFRRLDRNTEALAAYDRALTIAPRYAWAWNGRGLVLEALGRREEALASYERARMEDGGTVWYYINQIDLLLQMNRAPEALELVDQALKAMPKNAAAWARRGQVLRRSGDHAAAIESYQRAVELDPNYAWAWNGQGLSHMALGQPDQAVTCFENAVVKNPTDIWFWLNYGDAWLLLGDAERAVEIFQQALQLDPGHEPTRRKLKQAQDQLRDRDNL